MSYIVMAPAKSETDDMKDSIFDELEHVFDKFPKYPKYHMKVLLGDFIAKVCRKPSSNQQLVARFYMKLIIIMELEYYTSPHPKI